MDETIDIAQTTEHTETDRQLSEQSFQQLLDDSVNTTKNVQVKDVKTAQFICSQNGANRYEVELSHPDLTFSINLRKALSQDAAVDFLENHTNNQSVYVTLVVLSHAGQQQPYLADISHSATETEAVAAQADRQIGADGRMPVTFDGDIDTIRFGREESLRSFLPSLLNTQSLRPTKSNNKALAIMSVLLFLAWAGSVTAFALLLVIGSGSYYLSRGTHTASHIDVDKDILVDETQLQTEVWDCTIRHQDDSVIVQPEDHSDKWVFDKSSTGELQDRGKKAMQQLNTVEGSDSCIVPVQKTRLADTEHIRSETGEYSIVDKTAR